MGRDKIRGGARKLCTSWGVAILEAEPKIIVWVGVKVKIDVPD